MKRLLRYTGPVLALTIFLAGCVSTQERFEKGVDLETDGRFAEAAGYYVKVLKREPGWEEARERLEAAGAQAVDRYLAAANAAEEVDDYEQAVRQLGRLDALRASAAQVGVALPVPEDYEAYRAVLLDGAIASLLHRGERAEQRGAWREALEAYDRVARYEPTLQQQDAVQRARARTLLGWSEQDLARERFRAAYERAGQVFPLVAPEGPEARHARDVQAEALAAGTRYVVFLPVGRGEAVGPAVPRGVEEALSDVLQYEYWAEPPLFLAPADPVQLHRELRRLPYDRARITEREAAEIGRALDADLVVRTDLSAFAWEETELKEETRRARTRGRNPLDTTFVVQRYRAKLKGALSYTLMDPQTRSVVARGTVDDAVSERFERGRYAGDARDLNLSGSDRRLFDRDAQEEAERALEEELIDALARRLADRVYQDLLRQVD